MVEKGSPIEGSSIPGSESQSEILNKAYRDLFKDFCAIEADEKTKDIKYGKNTPQDEKLMGLAIQLGEGALTPESKDQKEQLTNFFDDELKKYPADKEPEEHLKIQKLKLITLHGRKWLESKEGKKHIEKVKQAEDLKALEKEKKRYAVLTVVQAEQSVLEEGRTAAEEIEESESSPEERLKEMLSDEGELSKEVIEGNKAFVSLRGLAFAISKRIPFVSRENVENFSKKLASSLAKCSEEYPDSYLEIEEAADKLWDILSRAEAELDMNTRENPQLLDELAAGLEPDEQPEILGPRAKAAQEFKGDLLKLVTSEKDEDGNITKGEILKNAQLRKRVESLVSPYNIVNESSLQSSLEQIDRLGRGNQVPSEEADALCIAIYQQLQRLGEARINPYAGDLQEFLGAAFYFGSNNPGIESGQIRKDRNYIFRVENPSERLEWLLRNVGRFSEGIRIDNPQDVWRNVYNRWMVDFDAAVKTKELLGDPLSLPEIREFTNKIQSFMAVASAARAMEFSNGSAGDYVEAIAGFRNGELFLNAKDWFSPWTLQDNESKMVTVLSEPLVAHYYEIVLERAGVIMPDIIHPVDKHGKRIYPELGSKESDMGLTKWDYWIDKSKTFSGEEKKGKKEFRKDSLAFYLKERGGFDSFIEEVLMKEGKKGSKDENNEKDPKDEDNEEFERSEKWAAAKMACDAFLTGVYTKWTVAIDPESKYILKHSPREGGDPFRCVLEPMFLPVVIKKVYRKGKGGPEIVNLVNEAFCPDDLFYTDLRPHAVNKATKLILDILPHKEKGELDQLSADEISDLVSDAIEKIRPLLDGVAKEDGTYFKEGADPWKVITGGKKDQERAVGLLKVAGLLSMDQGKRGKGQANMGKSFVENKGLTAEEKEELNLVLWLRETIKKTTAEAASVCDVGQIEPDATHHLKEHYRYASSLMAILGGSRAPNLPEWNERIIEDLGKAVELLDDVYGKKGEDGKHLVGLMIARMIKAKVIASALERTEPDWKEKIGQIFNFPSKRIESYQQAEEALFGQDLGKVRGIIGDLMGERRSIIIKGNKYGAEEEIRKARQALRAAQGLGSGIVGSRAVMTILKSIGENIY